MKNLIANIVFLFFSTISIAQVTSISYSIDFDYAEGDTSFYDCNIHIDEGNATTISQRIQFNSQFSFVTPSDVSLEVIDSYMPLKNNQSYTGTEPIEWNIGTQVHNPIVFPNKNIYAINPYIDLNTFHYDDLYEDDILALFRIAIIGEITCPLDVRIYENDIDPTSSDLPGGTDYSNGFSAGSEEQLYFGNLYSSDYAEDIDITLNDKVSCGVYPAVLSPNLNCVPFTGLSYLWSTGETTQSISVTVEDEEEYTLTISGPNGYSELFTATVRDLDYAFANDGFVEFCPGYEVDLGLSSGALTSSDPSVLYGGEDGILYAISPGGVWVAYHDNDNQCSGEMFYTVAQPPAVTLTEDTTICIGHTTLVSSDGVSGSWSSADNNIATVTNAGVITGVGAGQTTFTFTSTETLCHSDPSEPLIVFPNASIELDVNQLCIGKTTFASSSAFGGTWTSDNPTIATIDVFTGEITAISNGYVTFGFTDSQLLCTSTSEELLVSPDIQVDIIGSDQICIGGTTQLSPSSGGLWSSDDDAVATVDHSGLVTGISYGSVTFIFQDTVNYCADGTTDAVVVGDVQGLAVVGPDEICLGSTTQLSPNVGGTWISEDVSIAVNDMAGEVTGVGVGSAVFNFISDLPNCQIVGGDLEVTVNDLPTIELTGPDSICVGFTTSIVFTGTLQSVEFVSATNDNNGLVTGVQPGVTQFFAVNGEGCSSDTIDIVVEPAVEAYFIGPDYICGMDITTVGPSAGGTWSSSNPSIATLTNSGLVTGISPGQVILTFLPSNGECGSANELTLVVGGTVTTSIEESIICLGETTQTSPSTGGTWTSSDPTIATIDNNGLILSVGSGTVDLEFTPTDNSCGSLPLQLTVLAVPTITTNETEVCQSDSLFVFSSNNSPFIVEGPSGVSDAIVTESEDGNFWIEFNSCGQYTLVPIDVDGTGCESEITLIEVYCSPIIEPASSPVIYVGDTLEIISSTQFIELFTEDNQIAIPNSTMSIVGVSAGETQVTAIGGKGCLSNTFTVTVLSNDPCGDVDTSGDPIIIGNAYVDANENGIWDDDEDPLRNVLVTTESGDFSILTDDNGQYQLNLQEGMYSLVAQVNEGIWVSNQLSIDIDVIDPCAFGFDFGFIPVESPIPMANLSMTNTIARCDWETRFDITVENIGSEILEGELQFIFDERTTLFSSDFPSIQVNGIVVSGQIDPLDPFSTKKYRVTVKMPGGSSNLPMLDFETRLVSQSGLTIADYGYSDQLRCSYDPNDKREYPDREGEDNLTLMDEDIEYTIRFQNNGNDTAFQVKIVDPLDPNIDPATIRVVSSSHDVETCIDGTDLIFLFEDILLVDSTTNYDASQGYVTFRCNTKEGRAEMTLVHNQANIIFDTNPPIVTNQTLNTLVSELCTDKFTMIEESICDGDSYEGYTVAGTYTEVFPLPFECDSVVTIVLEVQGITYSQQNIEVCEGETVTINGIVYTVEENITIKDTIINNGCITNIKTYEIVAITDILGTLDDLSLCQSNVLLVTTPTPGVWNSNDETIITIGEDGSIVTVGEGTTTLTFTDDENGCIDEISATVYPVPELLNTGVGQICINEITNIISDSEGFWLSDNNDIISVDNQGVVTALATGVANVLFTNIETGCSSSIAVEVLEASDPACIVSTSEEFESQVRLYPNPATEVVYIESELEWESIKVMNAQGKVVRFINSPVKNKVAFDISTYAPGVYMVRFENGDKRYSKKFLKL